TPAGSTTWISSPALARNGRARWRASAPSMIARPRSCEAKNDGTAPLHHVEGFVDRDRRAAFDHRAALRHLRRGAERRRLDDAVAGRTLSDRALGDAAFGVDLVDRARKRVAGIDHRRAQLGEPCGPLLHDPSLLRRRLRHSTTVIDQEIFHFFVLLR